MIRVASDGQLRRHFGQHSLQKVLQVDAELQIERLREFIKDRTTFIITHRLSSLELADRVVVMSRKGPTSDCDYESGGGYFTRNDEKCYFEAHLQLGDIVFYDTRVIHGVTEIDPAERFSQAALEGRFAGLVTLYRDLS